MQAREQSSRNLFFCQRWETNLMMLFISWKNSVNLSPGFEILPVMKAVWRFCTNLHNIIAFKFDIYTVLFFLRTSCEFAGWMVMKKQSTELRARSILVCSAAFISRLFQECWLNFETNTAVHSTIGHWLVFFSVSSSVKVKALTTALMNHIS